VAEAARSRATRCGSAAAALAEAERERAAIPRRSRSKAALRLGLEVVSLRDMARGERDATYATAKAAADKRAKRVGLVHRLLTAIAEDDGDAHRNIARALRDVFDGEGVAGPAALLDAAGDTAWSDAVVAMTLGKWGEMNAASEDAGRIRELRKTLNDR
jgi:hypothetical protein